MKGVTWTCFRGAYWRVCDKLYFTRAQEYDVAYVMQGRTHLSHERHRLAKDDVTERRDGLRDEIVVAG